jgi:DNA-binding CsgD family transcriptional regulator
MARRTGIPMLSDVIILGVHKEGLTPTQAAEKLGYSVSYIDRKYKNLGLDDNAPSEIERFEVKYARSDSGCWEWLASKNRKGYGLFSSQLESSAHRFSYSHYVGEIPVGIHVLHKCDNPSCVNPNHLFLGSNADNMADKVAKGRQPKGKTHVFSTLTDEILETIFQMRSEGKSTKEIGLAVNLHPSTISKYLKKYLVGKGIKTKGTGAISRQKLEDMWMLVAARATNKQIGEILGVTDRTINEWRQGRIEHLADNEE